MKNRGNSRGGHYYAAAVALSSATPAPLSSSPVASDAKPESLIPYGANDKLPNELLGLIMSSSTAKRCFDKRARYIEANGFQDRALSEMVLGDKTADTLLHETVPRVADLGGIAWALVYDKEAGVEKVIVLPFSCIRKRSDGNFILNYGYQNEKRPSRKDDIYFLKWEPGLSREKLAKQFAGLAAEGKHYEGHLYYRFNADRDLYNHYPLPTWYSNGTLADIEADAAASLLDRKNITQGFIAGVHVHAVGEQYKSIEVGTKENGLPILEDAPAMSSLKSTIRDLKGTETEATAMVTASAIAEEKVTVTILDTGKAYQGMTDVSDRVAFKVCKGTGVSPLLIGLTVAGKLGTSQELKEASRQLADEVIPDQNMISRAFAEVWGIPAGKNWDLSSLAPKLDLPVQLFEKLDTEQQKAYLSQFV